MRAPERIDHPGATLRIWREAPALEGRRTAAIGAFACDTAAEGAGLLRKVAATLAAEGFEAVIGPMDGDTWSRHRLVVESDGRAPFLMEPSNPEHYPGAFDQADWPVIARYASAEGPLTPAQSKPLCKGVALRAFDPVRTEEDLERIHALSLKAFAGNFLYRPQSLPRFLASYRPLLPALDPELIVLAEDDAGALQGFLFAAPDLSAAADDRAVVLKTYASVKRGLGSQLTQRLYERAAARGYTRVIHALMHHDNLSAQHSAKLGAEVFRSYALWGLRL
ncbi:MAG TPA: hypothetical protein VGL66_16920 [Caulobacteraceae bacterium]|jgi:L-amino acid N-acyltransferase YncA